MNIDEKKQYATLLTTALRAAIELGSNNINRNVFRLFVAQANLAAERLYPLDREALESLIALKKFESDLHKSSQARPPHSPGRAQFF